MFMSTFAITIQPQMTPAPNHYYQSRQVEYRKGLGCRLFVRQDKEALR